MKKSRIGVTGYSGFIGSHLLDRLAREVDLEVIRIEDASFKNTEELKNAINNCDTIVHLAGMNRGDEKAVYSVNIELAKTLVACLEELKKCPHLIFSSSILTSTDTAFGRAKKEACKIFDVWSSKNGAPLSLLTIPNVFGDRGKPFYNSVVATFCHQLTHGEQPKIIKDREVEFIYINDLIEIIVNFIKKPPKGTDNVRISETKMITVSELLSTLEKFRDYYFQKKIVPKLDDPFLLNLYNVFLSYVEYDELKYFPEVHKDKRGELFEIIKLAQGGQVFFSTTKPGIIRGNHYHARKIERFCVLKGKASIRLRRIGADKIEEYKVTLNRPTFVEIPIFHAHHIENTGKDELYTMFWCNEIFDPNDPDTYYEEVYKS